MNFFFRWLSLDSLWRRCSAGCFTFKITLTVIRSPYSWPSWQPFPQEFVELERELNRIHLFCSRLSQFSWFDCYSVGRQQITSSPKAALFIYCFLIGCFFVVWLVMKKLYKQKLVGRNLTPMELFSCFLQVFKCFWINLFHQTKRLRGRRIKADCSPKRRSRELIFKSLFVWIAHWFEANQLNRRLIATGDCRLESSWPTMTQDDWRLILFSWSCTIRRSHAWLPRSVKKIL